MCPTGVLEIQCGGFWSVTSGYVRIGFCGKQRVDSGIFERDHSAFEFETRGRFALDRVCVTNKDRPEVFKRIRILARFDGGTLVANKNK